MNIESENLSVGLYHKDKNAGQKDLRAALLERELPSRFGYNEDITGNTASLSIRSVMS